MDDQILAIVVTFNRVGKLDQLLNSITNQVNRILIIDNGSPAQLIEEIRRILRQFENVEILFNPRNVGLASAQNQGVVFAEKQIGISSVLFLDDDSLPDRNMVSRLVAARNTYESETKKTVGIIAPNPVPVGNEKQFFVLRGGILGFTEVRSLSHVTDEIYSVISSGSLIPLNTFKICGYFKSEYFIDCIDTEYSLRVVKYGLKVIIVPNAILNHSIGEISTHNFLGKKVTPWNHSARRKYFIIRNRIWMWKDYFFTDFPYVLFEIKRTLSFIAHIVLFENHKTDKLGAVVKGIIHGIFRKSMEDE